jgi:4-amino-4-deoxy-L-arabinose transferase-like glycosyltransferase
LVGLGGYYLWNRRGERILQLIVSFLVSALVWFPWYRTNWIFLFSTIQNSNSIPATLEGDPSLNTLAAWTYYWQDLPFAVSWVLLIIPVVGLLLHLLGRFPPDKDGIDAKTARRGLAWLALYFGGAYFVCSSIYNKDTRYILPYLPILAIFLAYGLIQWRGRWTWVRGFTIALALLVAIAKLFPLPIPDNLAQSLSPSVNFRPYLGQRVPDAELIESVIQKQPYQTHTLGVIANTDSVNHNTLNFFGTLRDFQVKGRELGVKPEEVQQDGRSLDWFVTKTGANGFARDTQLALADRLKTDPQFTLQQRWQMPDNSELRLFHRKIPLVSVEPFSPAPTQITLDRVTVPTSFPPGHPTPIRYEWLGKGQDLAEGIVLLTWRSVQNPETSFWIHDHGLGMGTLLRTANDRGLRVIENTAMLPTADLPAGDYQLDAIYLQRNTGVTYPIAVPKTRVHLDPQQAPIPAPELDLVTQLRQLALNLPKGIKGLDPIFRQVDRLNQYDPNQDYLNQAEIALNYRLSHDSQPPVEWRYGVILANVLQQEPNPLIDHLETLIEQDPSNPYFSAYLAFVYLYNWQPYAAQKALQPALILAKNVPEIQGLNAIAALMQGNLVKAWQIGAPLLKKS